MSDRVAQDWNPGRALRRSGLVLLLALAAACNPSSKEDNKPAAAPTAPANRFEIEGKVTVPDQPDSSGIQVFIPGSSALAMTDAQGHYLLTGLSAGVQVVSAQRPGYQTAKLGEPQLDANAAAKRVVLPDKVLDPVATPAQSAGPAVVLGAIKGKIGIVSDTETSEEHDFSGARVELEGTQMRTIAEPNGDFFLWNVKPGKYQLAVQMPGYAAHRTEITVSDGPDPTVVDVTLSAAPEEGATDREIDGTVELLASDDSPLTDFSTIRIGIRELPDRRIKVDANGSFRIRALPPGNYTIYGIGEGFAPSDEVSLDLSDVPSADVTLTLHANATESDAKGTIHGTAVKNSPDATDMSGISVALAGTSFVAVTDADGNYRIFNVPAGTYDIVAQAEGYESAKLEGIELAAGQTLAVDDLALNPLRDYPVVLDTSPPNNARDVLISYQITIVVHFSKKMKPESLKQSVSIAPDLLFSVFTNHEHPQADEESMVIVIDGASPERPIKYDTQFRITIADTAEDVEGLRLERPYVLSLRTGKPAVIATVPGQGVTEASLNPGQPLVFTFNARLNPDSVDPRNIRIRPSIGVVPTLNIMNDPRSGWSSLQLSAIFNQDTRYEITLPRRIKTATGQYISNTPYHLRFKTSKSYQLGGPSSIPVH